MNIELALEKLFSLHTFGIKLSLDNITRFLEYLGNPQKQLKTFHIAGSNGKGSTASFIASILMEFGYKVGLYTSPHFVRFNERIQINSSQIPDDYLAKFINDYSDYIEENKLTFFEVTTAVAFKYFYENNVDYAVIETGLGGRLDATNVLNPLAVLITSISLEHTAILGTTIKDIAGEKAGIIKNNSQVFIGRLPGDAENVIDEKCRETNSKLFKIEDYAIIKGNDLELYTEEIEFDDWSMPLKGQYQKFNAALAGLAVSKVLLKDDLMTISKGIKNVIKNTGLQGRFEYYSTKPDIIFDSAHNPEGIDNFLSEFKSDMSKYSKRVLLFGVMKDKSIKGMLSNLSNFFDEIHITQVNIERSSKIEDLHNIAEDLNIEIISEPDPVEFVKKFKEQASNNCLVVLGSMYLVGEIKSAL
ncbi:MAG: folylpolyglutamate synthase/dihydrofolate synthase family protein [Ignavibacteriaceae bacterium]|jgi:dihydrofolate synthase/folylpolyglutamate synthase